MEYLVLGFFTGLSLILAIGAQNIFVIEQGLKKQHIFLVCFSVFKIKSSYFKIISFFLNSFLFKNKFVKKSLSFRSKPLLKNEVVNIESTIEPNISNKRINGFIKFKGEKKYPKNKSIRLS